MAQHKTSHTDKAEEHTETPPAPTVNRASLAGVIMAALCSSCHPDEMKAKAPCLAEAAVVAADALAAELAKPVG